jgi:hypothetical protein
MPVATGSLTFAKDDRDRLRLPLDGNGRRGAVCYDDVGLRPGQLLRECSYLIDVAACPTKVYPHIAAIGPTQVCKRLSERRDASLPLRIVFVRWDEHADATYSVGLLRGYHKRPRRRAAEPCDELPPPH